MARSARTPLAGVRRGRVRRGRLFACLLVVALALPSAAATFASSPQRAWPRPIRVYNPTAWQHSISSAVDAWNRSGANVRFTLVDRAAGADVIVVASDRRLARACLPADNCIGYSSQIGYRGGTGRPVRLYLPTAPRREPRAPAATTATAAHELGHVLGLSHRDGCAIMNSEVLLESCPAKMLYPTGSTFLCGPEAADIDAAVALYGGRRDPAYRPVCPRRVPAVASTTPE